MVLGRSKALLGISKGKGSRGDSKGTVDNTDEKLSSFRTAFTIIVGVSLGSARVRGSNLGKPGGEGAGEVPSVESLLASTVEVTGLDGGNGTLDNRVSTELDI